jgi:hypothetical protein
MGGKATSRIKLIRPRRSPMTACRLCLSSFWAGQGLSQPASRFLRPQALLDSRAWGSKRLNFSANCGRPACVEAPPDARRLAGEIGPQCAISSGCKFAPPAVRGFDGSKCSRSSRFWTSARATTKASFRPLAFRSATLKKASPK